MPSSPLEPAGHGPDGHPGRAARRRAGVPAEVAPAPVSTVVLLNPRAAGGRAARLLPAVRAQLDRDAPATVLHASPGVDDALAWLRALPRGTRVVVAGGDGTVHRMLPALLERGHQLALLPCGTGNDTARALGVHGLGAAAALAVALRGEARAIDVGEVALGEAGELAFRQAGGRSGSHDAARGAEGTGACHAVAIPFISSLAAGFDAAVAQRALRAPGWLRGLPRYLVATLAELAALRRFEVDAWIDGRPQPLGDTLLASTLNTRSYGSGMPAAPAARLDDGRLDLLVAGRFGTLGALAMMPLLLSGAHLRHPRVRTLTFEVLRLRARPPLPLAADGEALPDAAEVTVRVRPAALWVVGRPA